MVPAIQDAMKACSMPVWQKKDIITTIGERVEATNLRLFGKEDGEEAGHFWKCVEHYQREVYIGRMCTYPQIPEMLDQLRKKGYHTAVCSNAEQNYIEEVLERLKLNRKIDKIRPIIPGKEKVHSLKVFLEDTTPEFALMVGDRIYDIEAARENQIKSVGCLYGCGTHEELREADYLVEKPMEILNILECAEKN